MTLQSPLKVMYLNPLASSASYDIIFAEMARAHKLPQTEVHVASLPESEGGFTHIEFRAYEAMVTRGIMRAVRAAAREGFDALAIGCFYDTALHDARELCRRHGRHCAWRRFLRDSGKPRQSLRHCRRPA